MTTIDGLAFDRDEEVAILRIDRQDRGNSLDTAFHARLADAYASIKADRSIRAIVLTGAGGEVLLLGPGPARDSRCGRTCSAQARRTEGRTGGSRAGPMRHDIWLPFIVSVNGTCAGSGFHFIADANIVIASPNASFVDTHCAVGQVSVLEPLNLLHRVSVGELLRLVVLGRAGRIDAQEALRISLVNEVVEGNLLARAVELGHAASRNSPSAVEASKRALWAAAREPMRPYLQYGWDLLRAQWTHPDGTRGRTGVRREARSRLGHGGGIEVSDPVRPKARPVPPGELGLWNWAAVDPDRPAMITQAGRTLSFAELAELANQSTHGLRAAGCQVGDTIAVMLPNDVELMRLFLGAIQGVLYHDHQLPPDARGGRVRPGGLRGAAVCRGRAIRGSGERGRRRPAQAAGAALQRRRDPRLPADRGADRRDAAKPGQPIVISATGCSTPAGPRVSRRGSGASCRTSTWTRRSPSRVRRSASGPATECT